MAPPTCLNPESLDLGSCVLIPTEWGLFVDSAQPNGALAMFWLQLRALSL